MKTFTTQTILATLAYSILTANGIKVQAQAETGCFHNFALEGETCEGFDENTGEPFPSCDLGLKCVDSGLVTIPGAGNICEKDIAYENETCEGFDYMSGRPFPSCGKGLLCMATRAMTLPGAEKTCRSYKDAGPVHEWGQCDGFTLFDRPFSLPCEEGLECVDQTCVRVKPLAKEGEACEGFDYSKGRPYPSCGEGLVCEHFLSINDPIPGVEKMCFKDVPMFAQEGQKCKGFNEITGMPYPICDKGLKCVDSGNASVGGGAGNVCVVEDVAGPGENCEGFNEKTEKPFPNCGDGLICLNRGGFGIPGAQKVCYEMVVRH